VTTSNPTFDARVWAAIDLSALVSNARTVADASGVRLLPMLKANGYGVGAVPVARALDRIEPWGFGLAAVEEAAELRSAGIARPLLVFTPFRPAQFPLYQEFDLRPAIGDLEALRLWTAQSDRPFHIEIDTGMGRAGFRFDDPALIAELGKILAHASGWEGLYTHFHSADEHATSLEDQWRRLEQIRTALPRKPPLVHAANSGAALRDRRYGGDLVRPGIFLYGGEAGGRYPLTVVRLESRVVALRKIPAGGTVSYGGTWSASAPVTVATLSIGYADGLHRSLSNRGKVELHGHLVPIVGRVTMDLTMIAVPESLPVALGDTVIIFGGRTTLDQQAAAAGTISYELLTSMGNRVERRYQ
jgi:alanine racemase